MTTTTKIVLLLAGVFFLLLMNQATGWVAASDSSGSSPDRPDTLTIEEEGSVSGIGLAGDVNCDGFVNGMDAALILQYVTGFVNEPPCPQDVDAYQNGVLNAVDAALILQFSAGFVNSLPASPQATPFQSQEVIVSISSAAMNVPDQGKIELGVRDVKDPGLGAWTIDVSYDPNVVSAKNCSAAQGGVCNPNFDENVVRVAGASAGGLEGDTILLSITFTCNFSGVSPLLISVSVLADATIGAPQDMDFTVQNGMITCDGTPTPDGPTPTHTPTPSGPTPTGTSNGWMTSGGSIFTENNVRTTHGFTLYCSVTGLPNSLQVNQDGDSFYLESLDFARCTDDPNIDPNPPTADFDTYEGQGSGRYNGVSGARAVWTFTDSGQPGRNDTAAIRIFDAGGNLVIEAGSSLRHGNHQAHSSGAPKPSPSAPPTATLVSTSTPGPADTPGPFGTPFPTTTPTTTPTSTPVLPITPGPTISPTITPVVTPGEKPEMALNVKGADCNDPVRPVKCNLPLGSQFILSVDVLTAPADGYLGLQTFMDFGTDLAYKKRSLSDEIVWPDQAAISLRDQPDPGVVVHGALSGLLPPLPLSFFQGPVLELLMNCTSVSSSSEIVLIPEGDPVAGTSGTAFLADFPRIILANVGPLTINCTNNALASLDTDGDGCTDVQEFGPDEAAGGRRDPNNAWDFYDINGDGVIDLSYDIFNVILAYASYDVIYDRGPSTGPNAWNMTAPDGVIDLSNDILGVIQQYQHSCQ